jgi:hypothetical protein
MRLWSGCRAVWRHARATWTWGSWAMLGFWFLLAAWIIVAIILGPPAPPPVRRPTAPGYSVGDIVALIAGLVMMLWEGLKAIPDALWWILLAAVLLHNLLKGHAEREALWRVQELRELEREMRKQRRVLRRIERQIGYAIGILQRRETL